MRPNQRSRKGISRQTPKGDSPAPSNGRSYLVRTKHGQPFRRAGLLFGNDPITITEAEIGPERIQRILEEAMLQCDEVTPTA